MQALPDTFPPAETKTCFFSILPLKMFRVTDIFSLALLLLPAILFPQNTAVSPTEKTAELLTAKWQPQSYVEHSVKKELDFPALRQVVFFSDGTFAYQSIITSIWGKWKVLPGGKKIKLYDAEKTGTSFGGAPADEVMQIEKLTKDELILLGNRRGAMVRLKFKRVDDSVQSDDEPKHGYYSKANAAGIKEEEGNYVRGRQEGVWTTRYAGGQIKSQGSYANGKKNNDWKYYTEDGNEIPEVFLYSKKETSGEKIPYNPLANGEYKKEYANGKPEKKGTVKDGLETGLWTSWDKDGNKSSEGFYENGKRTGKWLSWNGNLRSEMNYVDGKLQGTFIRKDTATGRTILQGEYVNGLEEGRWMRVSVSGYWNKGDSAIEYFTNGKPDGNQTVWDTQKKLKCAYVYKKGKKNGLCIDYVNGIKKWESEYLDDTLHGKSRYFLHDGKLSSESEYDHGISKRSVTYTSSGEKSSEKASIGKDSVYTVYYRKGMKTGEGIYLKEKRHGKWTYYEKGKLHLELNFMNGEQQGVCRFYFPGGSIKLEGNYVDGKRQGEWKEYKRSGKLKKVMIYKNGQLVN